MTTTMPVRVTCSSCRQPSEQHAMASTSTFGSPDLDLRPPPMMRFALHLMVQRCPSCGFCAPSIDRPFPEAASIVSSGEYRQILGGDEPEVAKTFLAIAFLEARRRAPDAAGFASLRAAWACDDSGHAGATRARKQAAAYLQEALKAGLTIQGDAGGAELLLSDIMRRAGEPDRAKRFVEEGLAKKPADIVRRLLLFQEKLLEKGDVAAHTVQKALEGPS